MIALLPPPITCIMKYPPKQHIHLQFLNTKSILMSCWQKYESRKGKAWWEGGIIYVAGCTAMTFFLQSLAPSYAITKLLVIEINFFSPFFVMFCVSKERSLHSFLLCLHQVLKMFIFQRPQKTSNLGNTYLTKDVVLF